MLSKVFDCDERRLHFQLPARVTDIQKNSLKSLQKQQGKNFQSFSLGFASLNSGSEVSIEHHQILLQKVTNSLGESL